MYAGIRVVDLALGASHGIALTSDGSLYAWGTHERAQITRPVPQLLNVLNPSFKVNGKWFSYLDNSNSGKSEKLLMRLKVIVATKGTTL